MEMHEINKLKPEELQKKIAELKSELEEARFGAASLQLKDVRKIRTIRQDIARMNTVLRQQTQS